jgi:4-hydroxy-3-polyprenylbenzoate decarboxylase
MKREIVVAITGASGAAYAIRLIEVLLAASCNVHLVISEAAQVVLEQELGLRIALDSFREDMLQLDQGETLRDPKLQALRTGEPGVLRFYYPNNGCAALASGSFPTDGMVVCPCSCNTLGAIANGITTNLIHRAAEVHLKERRRLILVPRETPLSLIQIDNMKRAAEAGAVILPACPAFYHGVQQIADLVDFVVARIVAQLNIPNQLTTPWGG